MGFAGDVFKGGGLTSAALGTVIPEVAVLELPFLFESYEEGRLYSR